MGAATQTQLHYQFQEDGADANTSTLLGTEDVANTALSLDTTYLLRIKISGGGMDTASSTFDLQYNVDLAGWNAVTGASSNVRAVAGSDTDGDAMTTERLSTTGNTYDTTNSTYEESGITPAFVLGTTSDVELVYSIQFRSADLTTGLEEIDFRVVLAGATTLTTYTVTPEATMPTASVTAEPLVGTLALDQTLVPTTFIEYNVAPDSGKLQVVTRFGLELRGHTPTISVSSGSSNNTEEPGAGSLTLAGVTPTLGISIVVPVGSLTVASEAPSAEITHIKEVPVETLVIASSAPSVLEALIRGPPVGALVLTGVAPSAEIDHFKTPSPDGLAITGIAPETFVGFLVSPTVDSLAISGNAPSSEIDHFKEVPVGSLALGSSAPTVTSGALAVPTVGSLQISGVTPDPITNHIALPSVDSLALASTAPTILNNVSSSPTVGSLALTGNAPTVITAADYDVTVPVGALVLTGEVPEAPQQFPLEPGTDHLVITGIAPSVEIEHNRSMPVGALVISSVAPLANVGFNLGVPSGKLNVVTRTGLQLKGYAPTVNRSEDPDMFTGSLTLAGQIPTITSGFSPNTASLSITSEAPTISALVAPSSGSLSITGQLPVQGLPGPVITVPVGALNTGSDTGPNATPLTMTGYAPSLEYIVKPGVVSLTIDSAAPTRGPDPITVDLVINSDLATTVIENPIKRIHVLTGALVIGSDVPTVEVADKGVPSDTLVISSDVPTLAYSYTITIPVGSLTISSAAPDLDSDVFPLYVQTTITDAVYISTALRDGTTYTMGGITEVAYTQGDMSEEIFIRTSMNNDTIYLKGDI